MPLFCPDGIYIFQLPAHTFSHDIHFDNSKIIIPAQKKWQPRRLSKSILSILSGALRNISKRFIFIFKCSILYEIENIKPDEIKVDCLKAKILISWI